MGSTLKLDGVVCVVDSMNLLSYLDKDDLEHDVKMQICYADRILLNKSDTVDESGKKKVLDEVTRLNGMAEVQQTTYSKVTPEWVLDIDCYSTKDPTNLAFSSGQGLLDDTYCVPCDPSGVPTTVLNAAISKHSADRLTTLPMSILGS